MPRFQSLSLAACALAASLFVSGCSTSFAPSTTVTDKVPLGTITGRAHGGRQPIVGARVFVMAAGSNHDGGPGIVPSEGNTSVSLLTSVSSGSWPTAYDSTINGYYVTTDSTGSFLVSSEYTCTPGQLVYLLSLGGKPDGVTENDSVGLMAVLGQCPNTGTLAATTPIVLMNEVSTVAAAYALAGFASDATHVSSANSSLALTGIANAFANAGQLYNIGSPTLNANATTPNGNGVVPQSLLDTLANSLAACVNSVGTGVSACDTLFANTKDFQGNQPTDTASAAINIAHNPGANVDAIFNLPGPIGSYPFTPKLGAAQEPADFSVGITFSGSSVTGHGLNSVQDVAVDASGNLWATSVNNASVTEFSPLGVPTFINSGGINFPIGVAIDQLGSVWVANSNPSVTKIVAGVGTNIALSTNPSDPGANSIAVDSNDDIWISTYSASTAYELNTSGGTVAGPFSFSSPSSFDAGVIAIDSGNSLWGVVQYGGDGLIGISGTTPTEYPQTTFPELIGNSGIAADSSSNLWAVANCGSCGGGSNEALALINAGGNIVATFPDPSLYGFGVALDGNGNVWVAQGDPSGTGIGAVQFNNSGALVSPAAGYAGGSQNYPAALAIDGSGNVWLGNTGASSKDIGTTVVELIGAATPVVTPISPTYPGQVAPGLGVRP